VHKNASFIFLQLQALGRTASPDVLQEEGGYPLVAPSPTPLPTIGDENTSLAPSPLPRALTVEEIGEYYVQLYALAARNTVLGAGFEGVEIHGANGYLPDQFLQTNSNERTDLYGSLVKDRARFVLEVAQKRPIDACKVIDALGEMTFGSTIRSRSVIAVPAMTRERQEARVAGYIEVCELTARTCSR
jgi:2,4-dienoyl-CoA reductase-like NADH-dependent reductase (Old Yellow Enzyme family)